MKQKHIDASREARLWLGQILLPLVGVIVAVPESREWLVNKYYDIRKTIAK